MILTYTCSVIASNQMDQTEIYILLPDQINLYIFLKNKKLGNLLLVLNIGYKLKNNLNFYRNDSRLLVELEIAYKQPQRKLNR